MVVVRLILLVRQVALAELAAAVALTDMCAKLTASNLSPNSKSVFEILLIA